MVLGARVVEVVVMDCVVVPVVVLVGAGVAEVVAVVGAWVVEVVVVDCVVPVMVTVVGADVVVGVVVASVVVAMGKEIKVIQ